jgi:hypothetical protein
MRISTGLFLSAALILTSVTVAGCDDKDSGEQNEKHETHAAATPKAGADTDGGWISASEQHLSVWRFVRPLAPLAGSQLVATSQGTPAPQPTEDTQFDPLAETRTAVGANMLPARNRVHAADLVNRALQSADPPDPTAPPPQPAAVLVTTPWNEDTLLLWIAVPSPLMSDKTTVSVEFNPKTVATFRPLGDPSALPLSAAIPGWIGRAAMLYELSPQPDNAQAKLGAAAPALKYGIVHIAEATSAEPRIDRAISTGDAVDGIDDVPDPMQFAVAVAGFGGLLRGDPALHDLSCHDIIALAEGAALPDPDGWHSQMIAVMRRAEPLIDMPSH